jgi:predicted nucleic acid-binding protein
VKKKYVIDSSVFIKIFLHEEDSEKTKALLSKIIDKNNIIIVPNLFFFEILQITTRYPLDTEEIYKHLAKQHYIKEYELSEDVVSQTVKITKAGNKKSGYPAFYDSCYHALAILNGCDFITADKKHYEKAKKFGHIKLLSEL